MKGLVRGQKARLSDLALGDSLAAAIHLVTPARGGLEESCFGTRRRGHPDVEEFCKFGFS